MDMCLKTKIDKVRTSTPNNDAFERETFSAKHAQKISVRWPCSSTTDFLHCHAFNKACLTEILPKQTAQSS